MRARLTRLTAALAALAALAVGGAALASAQGGGSQPAQAPAAEQERDDGEQNPTYRSSITAPEQDLGSEEAEAKALRSKATVTPDEARNAALAAVPGKAGEVELDNENGNVVYSVEVAKTDGSQTDVKVDAGNATVLSQEADGEEGNDAEQAETGESAQSEQSEADEGTEAEQPGR